MDWVVILYTVIGTIWFLAALCFLGYQVFGFYLGHEYGTRPRENARLVIIGAALVLLSPLWLLVVIGAVIWGGVRLFKDIKSSLDNQSDNR